MGAQGALFSVWHAHKAPLLLEEVIISIGRRPAPRRDLVWKAGEKEGPMSAKPVITGYGGLCPNSAFHAFYFTWPSANLIAGQNNPQSRVLQFFFYLFLVSFKRRLESTEVYLYWSCLFLIRNSLNSTVDEAHDVSGIP